MLGFKKVYKPHYSRGKNNKKKNTNYFAPAVVANIAKIEGKSSNLNFKGNVTKIDF